MFIKDLDFVSPRITIYHQGYLSHSSILSGVLSVISIILIFLFAIYFLLDIIQRENPNSSYFNSFTENAPNYQINSTSLFHFINIAQTSSNTTYEGIDFTAFRIIGFQRYYLSYLNDKNISLFHHWLYGYCDNETDTKGISQLITYDFFGKSACIKKFWDTTEQNYFDKGHPKFQWPELDHGVFHEKNKVYDIVVERCQEDTIGYILGEGFHCRSELEMKEYYSKRSIGVRLFHFYFIDNYIDIFNYKNPTNKFFYRIETRFYTDKFSVNDISLNPTKIRTENGIISRNKLEEISYNFDRNGVYREEKENTDLFMVYHIFLINIVHYYERNYKKIQDVFSSIGGIYQIVLMLATYINALYNQYMILSDTDLLLQSSIYNENLIFEEKNKKFKNSFKDLYKEKEKEKEKERNKEKSENKIKNEKKNSERKHSEDKKNITDKSINRITNSVINSKIMSVNEELKKENRLSSKEKKENNIIKKQKTKNNEKNFFSFLLFKITCGKKFSSFDIYRKFRMKIISEEHLIRNHLNVYNLLRITEKKRSSRKNSYRLKNLIKLI